MAAAGATAAAAGPKHTVLITGASRGIGLGLVQTFVAKGYRVIAAARHPAGAAGLQAVVKAHPNACATVVLDVSDTKSIAGLRAQLAALQPAVERVDVLINNAGIKSPSEAKSGKPMTLATETEADFTACFATNVTGTHFVTQSVLPLLRAATKAGGATVVNISSVMGSIDAVVTGTSAHNPVYRITKTALNSLSACQAREFNADAVAAAAATKAGATGGAGAADAASGKAPALVTVLAVHPGWVQTDMGKAGGRSPPVTIEQSTQGIAALVEGTKPSPDAAFLQFDGTAIKW